MAEGAWKGRLARVAARIEQAIERLLVRPRIAKVITPYVGYATPEHLVVRGRVLAASTDRAAVDGQSRLENLRQMARMFATDEVADVEVASGAVTGQTDEEGYFTLLLPREPGHGGVVEVPVTAGDVQAICRVVVPDPAAQLGVISDIDDTMMRTEAWSLWRNLWTSLTGNDLSREVFADALRLMEVLRAGGRNPVFFVSSSPWNLYAFLRRVFDRTRLPEAPMFLRDYGISETQFITGTHGDHKGSAIDVILAANPGLDFVLIGDTGQHDAQVYRDAIERHPGRVAHVVLRQAGRLDAADAAALAALEESGVMVTREADYSAAIRHFDVVGPGG